MDIKLAYETTRDDILKVTRFYYSKTGRLWRTATGTLFLTVGVLSLFAPDIRALGIVLLVGGTMQFLAPRINAYSMVRRYFSNPALGRNVKMQITEGGIGIRTEVGAGSHTWSPFKSWMESPDAFLLIIYKGNYVMLPKRGFERQEDVAVLREFLRQTIRSA